MRPISLHLNDGAARPWFLWNEDLSVDEFRARLHGEDAAERDRLLALLLREANDAEVWQFVSPQQVADALPRLQRRLGVRRAPFWNFLIERWRRDGYVV
jgi:hypothetical protein